MLTDNSLDPKLQNNEHVRPGLLRKWSFDEWLQSEDSKKIQDPSQHPASASFSAGERDHLFLSSHAEQFTDLAGISGLDSPGDGRGNALLDYDRDGWYDLAVVNSNAPWLSLYHNRIGRTSRGQFIAVRFHGGNLSSTPDPQWTNRDGIGAMVTLQVAGHHLLRELRCGEGFDAQNSNTLLIGLGENSTVEKLSVRWPTGHTQELAQVAAGSLVTAFENPAHGPQGQAFSIERYRPAESADHAPAALSNAFRPTLPAGHPPAQLHLYMATATWCDACKRNLPQVAHLKQTFAPQELAIFGLPVDVEDDAAKLQRYLEQHHPAYTLLADFPHDQREPVSALLRDRLATDALPATIITDANGKILSVVAGLPTISDLRKLLDKLPQ